MKYEQPVILTIAIGIDIAQNKGVFHCVSVFQKYRC